MAFDDLGDAPPPSNLRAKIMQRRRERYGEGAAKSHLLSAEEWDREQARKPKRIADWQERRKPVRRVVYFVVSEAGPIKIGFTAFPDERVATLQIGSPSPLKMAAIIDGSYELEDRYHDAFAEWRFHGEWFAPHPDILAEIERLKAGAA